MLNSEPHIICRATSDLGLLHIITRLGSDVQGIVVGQLYAIWDAVPCVLAHPTTTLSPVLDAIGLGIDGGFAEYIAVDAAQLIPVVSGPSLNLCTFVH